MINETLHTFISVTKNGSFNKAAEKLSLAAPLPADREERNRRESARRHADIAEAQGKSAEEIHEIFKKVMNGTGRCSKR